MKKTLVLTVLLAWSGALASGEVFVSRKLHSNSYYHEGVMRPERNVTLDFWIGSRRMAYLAGPIKILLDLDKDTLLLVNSAERSYVQAKLSAPFKAAMSADELEATPDHEVKASVRGTGESRTIQGVVCRAYEIDLKSSMDLKVKVWMSVDTPVDIAAYKTFQKKMYGFLARYEPASVEALMAVPGFPVLQESSADLKGEAIRVRRETAGWVKKDPPADVFAVPEGFTRKSGLTHADLDLLASVLERP